MAKKIFFVCLMLLLGVMNAASAKDAGLPEDERINIAVEITNSSRYKELPTPQLLELFLNDKLVEKNLLNIVGTKMVGETDNAFDNGLILDEDRPVDAPPPEQNIGELLIFDAVELPRTTTLPKDFDADVYKAQGAKYIVRCEVLALGTTKVTDEKLGTLSGIIGGGLSFAGSGSNDREKTLRRVGTGIGLIGFSKMLDVTKRTALNTVVTMQFISAETGEIIWQENFVGQAIKHHHPRKGYDNVWTQAYTESIEDSAKLIAKRVNKYVDRVVIKGKSDKNFLPKKLSLGGSKLF